MTPSPMDDSEVDPSPPPRWSASWAQDEWLAATSQGLWQGRPGQPWRASGPYEHPLHDLARCGQAVVAAADGGLWMVESGADRWRQLHDELVTVVQAVAVTGAHECTILAGTAYGVHRVQGSHNGALRWANCSQSLPAPNARFVTALVPQDDQLLWVGTEAGLLCSEGAGARWSPTPLAGRAVRALLAVPAGLWAGDDAGELWFAPAGEGWRQVSRLPGEDGLLALAALPEGELLAGTTTGMAVFGRDGSWRRCGPRLTIACIAVDGEDPDVWCAGAVPGGLWWTRDGELWRQVPETPTSVTCLLPPACLP